PYPGPSVVTKTSGCFFGSQASGPLESKLFSSATPSLVASGVAQLSSADARETGDSNIAPTAGSATSQRGQRSGVLDIALLLELRVCARIRTLDASIQASVTDIETLRHDCGDRIGSHSDRAQQDSSLKIDHRDFARVFQRDIELGAVLRDCARARTARQRNIGSPTQSVEVVHHDLSFGRARH